MTSLLKTDGDDLEIGKKNKGDDPGRGKKGQ